MDVGDMKNTNDDLEREKDSENVIDQKSDHKRRDDEIKMVTHDVKSDESKLMILKKLRDEVQKELNRARQEQDVIEKKCSMLNELKEKVNKDIIDHSVPIVAPNSLKADIPQLRRLKDLVINKGSAMKSLSCLKKQFVMLLEQQLAVQEKQLHLVMEITEKNKKLTKFTYEFKITEPQQKSDIEDAGDNLKKIEFIEHEHDADGKLINISKEMFCDRISYLSMWDALQKQLDDMNKKENHSIETMKSLKNDVDKLNLYKNNFEIFLTTIMKEFDVSVKTLFQLTYQEIQKSEIGPKKLTND